MIVRNITGMNDERLPDARIHRNIDCSSGVAWTVDNVASYGLPVNNVGMRYQRNVRSD